MATCKSCGTMVVFGGKSWNGMRFCSEDCLQTAVTASYAEDIPEDIVLQHAMTIREGPCPVCGGAGPNDFHSVWSVFSIFVMTMHSKKQLFGCQSCGTKFKLKYFISTGIFGWWGIPWGLLITPFLELSNLFGLLRGVPVGPSEELKQMALMQISAELRRRVEADEEEVEAAGGPEYA